MKKARTPATPITITHVKFTEASAGEVVAGLLGWVNCVLSNTLRLDGLTLRRTADGRKTISYPARRDSSGRVHPIVRPLDDIARREVEAQIFRALGLENGA
jgi:hypothetical protein